MNGDWLLNEDWVFNELVITLGVKWGLGVQLHTTSGLGVEWGLQTLTCFLEWGLGVKWGLGVR